jgi:selenocysteine lyase/cysteine desulfurase
VLGADPGRVALPAGGTLALNVAIHGLVRPGDHVIATAADHNATLRPLHWLARRGTITLEIVPCDGLGRVDPADFAPFVHVTSFADRAAQAAAYQAGARPQAEPTPQLRALVLPLT